MKTYFIPFLFLTLAFHPVPGESQEKGMWYTGITAGMDFEGCDLSIKDLIREDRTIYGSSNASSSIKSLMSRAHLEANKEFRTRNDHLGFLAGLKFISQNSLVGDKSSGSYQGQYFFFLYKQNGLNTEYLRIQDFREHSFYIGVPLEIKLISSKTDLGRLFIKLGTELNYLVTSSLSVDFYKDEMNYYKNDVKALINKPNRFESIFYGAAGVCFPRGDKADLSMELFVPIHFLTGHTSGLVEPTGGAGARLSLQFPF